MKNRTIPIRNVYMMMAYAFRTIHNEGHDRLATESFEHVHDLFAEILARGVGIQVKRGLHHDYLQRCEALPTVRGRLNITSTLNTHSRVHGKLVCNFDEYEADTPHNQALKSVIVLLIRHGNVATPRKGALRRLLPYLDDVTLVAPRSIRWNELTFHRSNAAYRMLLGVCELVVRGLLPTKGPSGTDLSSWISDEAMSTLYERFLREYYAVHHPELSPRASLVSWDYEPTNTIGAEQLPAMRTDVTLKTTRNTLIIDAKYYGLSMQTSMWGKESIYSAHLYQMLAYTKNADTARDGSVSGLLLYARTSAPKQPDLDVVIQGNRISARTLDLDQSWSDVRVQLEDIASWLTDPSVSTPLGSCEKSRRSPA